MALFSCLALYCVVRYRIMMLNLEAFTQDMQTVTVADYTCEIWLSSKQCERALEKSGD